MAKQLAFRTHGGKRKNAGRKNRTGTPAHKKRPRVDRNKPLHVTIRTTPGLRKIPVLKRMIEACKRARKRGLRVIQFAMLGNHIHLIVEAEGNAELANGIKSMLGILAKRFGVRSKSRYHLTLITTPRQMKNTYRYVLLNYARHAGLPAHVDDYSSACTFTHWSRLARMAEPDTEPHETYGCAPPTSWLARTGWLRAA